MELLTKIVTAWKRSVFGVILVRSGLVRSISPYSVRMRENADQNNSYYGHFLHSELYKLLSTLLSLQKMRFSINDFFGKCDEISNFLRIWSHLLNITLMKNFIFDVVLLTWFKYKSFIKLGSKITENRLS